MRRINIEGSVALLAADASGLLALPNVCRFNAAANNLFLERYAKDIVMKNKIKAFVTDERGMQTGEYMVLGTVMAAGSIGAVSTVRDGIVDQFGGLTDGLNVDTDGSVGGEG